MPQLPSPPFPSIEEKDNFKDVKEKSVSIYEYIIWYLIFLTMCKDRENGQFAFLKRNISKFPLKRSLTICCLGVCVYNYSVINKVVLQLSQILLGNSYKLLYQIF